MRTEDPRSRAFWEWLRAANPALPPFDAVESAVIDSSGVARLTMRLELPVDPDDVAERDQRGGKGMAGTPGGSAMRRCPHCWLPVDPIGRASVCEYCGWVDTDDIAERDRADAANDLRRDK
jgi:hypothetical protein